VHPKMAEKLRREQADATVAGLASVDERIARLEEKLDRALEILEALATPKKGSN
jgi:hypothetical protein